MRPHGRIFSSCIRISLYQGFDRVHQEKMRSLHARETVSATWFVRTRETEQCQSCGATIIKRTPVQTNAANFGFAENRDWCEAQVLPRAERILALTDPSAAAGIPLFANCGNEGEGDESRFFTFYKM